MLNTLVIFFLLLVFFFFSLKRNGGVWITPDIGIYLGFILSMIGFLFCMNEWRVKLSNKALFVFIVGFTTIFITSMFIGLFYNIKNQVAKIAPSCSPVKVNMLQAEVWLLFQVFVAYIVSRYLKNEFSAQSLVDSIGEFRNANLYNHEGLKLPFIIRIPRSMCIYSGFYLIYVLAKTFSTNTRTINLVLIANIITSMFTACIVGGSRGELFRYCIVGATIYLFNSIITGKKVSKKTKAISAITGITLFLILFFSSFSLLGRGNISNKSDFLFWYLSGSIANFDYYVNRADYFQEDRSGTFVNLDRFKNKIGIKEIRNEASIGRQILYDNYNVFNGHSTGNVYTVFASFYHDGRILGVFFLSILFVVSGYFLLFLSIKAEQNNAVNIYIILYGYLFFDYTQSFFANRFFSDLLSENYIKFFLFLFVVSRLFMTRDSKEKRIAPNTILQRG